MKRIIANKIPGFPPHITSLMVAQEVFGHDDMTPVDVLLDNHRRIVEEAKLSNNISIGRLEDEMDSLDMDSDDYQDKVEDICNRIAEIEDAASNEENESLDERAHNALQFFGVPESTFSTPTAQLSGGIRKKVALASSMMEKPQLLLLDEPTCHIDIGGILQLRQLIADCVNSNTTVVLISHDVDLMNDVATDCIHFHNGKLGYYVGNYRDFLKYRKERVTHQVKQAGALEKQRSAMSKTIDNLKRNHGQSEDQSTGNHRHREEKSQTNPRSINGKSETS